MLYDLETDPNEFRDLDGQSSHGTERQRLKSALEEWGLCLSQQTTRSEQQMKSARGRSQRNGILIGVWDESDVPQELWSKYLGENT